VSDLFAGPAPRVRAIAATAPFLDTLAQACIAALPRDDDAFALSDALILLPNRRAARGLMDAFARALGGAALLPSIRPLADIDDDPDVWGHDPIELNVAPAIDPVRRRLELAALVRARDAAAGGVDDPSRALAYAEALCRLLDAASAVDDVDWSKAAALVDEDLAEHWRQSAEFLHIIATYWPQRLAADGLIDPGARRTRILHALAEHWTRTPPQTPVIIAGSTGSIAATRALMRTVAALPRGVVVFPGLDADMDDRAWAQINDQHPQFALKRTLEAVGVARGDVPALAPRSEDDAARARRVLLREALAPPDATADWLARIAAAGGGDALHAGASGLVVMESDSEGEEAQAIALMLRETLERPGETAMLVTPDAGLAQRVAAKLARWDIAPTMTQGAPLSAAPCGVLIGLMLDLIARPTDPVRIAAILKHPLVAAPADDVAGIERSVLRGPPRFADWPAMLAASGHDALLLRLQEALAPVLSLSARATISLAALCDALAASVEAVAGARAWTGEDGAACARVLRDLIAHGEALGAAEAEALARTVRAVLYGVETPPARGGDPRVAIMGPLEARLQRRDLMILGGLNEGVWPSPAAEDPFLSRSMRSALGFASNDERIGLAAHDFAQLAAAPRVVLSRARRAGAAPAVASRWLWRLETVLRVAAAERPTAPALHWARALDAPRIYAPCAPPAPRPPRNARLTAISVTGVTKLIRDPYAIYAERLLGLRVPDPIGKPPGPAEHGTAVHAAIERFGAGGAPDALLALIDEELARGGFNSTARAAARERLAPAAAHYVAWLKGQDAEGMRAYLERRGALDLSCGVTLTARADRIAIDAAGQAHLMDVKTGNPPSEDQVTAGFEPQLALEAAMLARGAFADVPHARTESLTYWRFAGSEPGPKCVSLKTPADALAEAAFVAFEKKLLEYADPTMPFLSRPRVLSVRHFGDFDHLARRQEWADSDDEGEA
jgi:ATP-dependent helicase/nuclease subunit B